MFRKALKKGIAVLTVTALVLSCAACGNEEKKEDASPDPEVEAEATEEPTEEPAAETPEPEPTAEPDDGNMIKDGGFDKGPSWAIYKQSGGSGSDTIENGELVLTITDLGEVQHGVQIYYDGFQLNEGAEYAFSFDARSTIPRTILNRFQMNGGDYHAYFKKPIKLTEEMQHYSFKFTMKEQSDPAPRLVFNCGYGGKADKGIGEHQIIFDNMRLELADDSNVVVAKEVDPTGIRVNQVGFRPDDVKTAVFADVAMDQDSYSIVDAKSGKEVYTGTFGTATDNPNAGETDRVVDFSDFKTPGTYKIKTPDGAESPKFKIAKNVYDNLLKKAVKFLYLQRCGEELDEKYAGKYAHKKCHTEKAHLYWDYDTTIDVSGGWHDAGDYGRYVVAGAKAAADVLYAYESYSGKRIIDDVGTPQSGDGVDDLLQEAKYELDWMLKMQYDEGKVYHKVTCKNFPSTVFPEEETDDLVVCFTSTPAIADFTAIMALAARIYGGTKNAEFKKAAKRYLKAAKKSWKYLKTHPDAINYSNPSDVVTGEYPDPEDGDERFWAAAEMYRTTGDESITGVLGDYIADGSDVTGLGWQKIGFYGTYSLLMNPKFTMQSNNNVKALYDLLDEKVEKTAAGADANPYAVDRSDDYEWGSNLGIANDGVLFYMADMIDGSNERNTYAQRQLSYLLGENATGYCFVTGFGSQSPEHPHHRISQVVGKAIPGMLVGGPDSSLEDPFAKTVLEGKPPAKCYADSDQSYSTNEVTIYWNSPLILLLAGLMK